MFTFFEPVLPADSFSARSKAIDSHKSSSERRASYKPSANKNVIKPSQNGTKSSHGKTKASNHTNSNGSRRSAPSPENSPLNVLDLKDENYYSCAVGRTQTNARYLLGTPDDVVLFLKELSDSSS